MLEARSGFFATLAAAVALATFGGPASAQQKMSQADAEYQDRPKNGLTCAACSLFRKPDPVRS